MKYLVALVFSLTLSSAFAAGGHDHSKCLDSLRKFTNHMISSGTNDALMVPREIAFREVYETAIRKGYRIPKEFFTHFLEPMDMAAMLATGAHPAPHPHDGFAVLRAAGQAAYIYEFIWPGQPAHHQYFRTVNTLPEDIRVAAHTCGHMHFAEHSLFARMRKADPVAASFSLAKLMEQGIESGERSQVARFYQLMLSTSHLQDFRRGSFEAPESFDERTRVQRNELRIVQQGAEESLEKIWVDKKVPRHPTPSILQFLVNDIPEEHGPMAREMVKRFEGIHRAFPWIVQTKFMNEGWSVFSEWFVLKDTKFNTVSDAVLFAQVSGASSSKSLTNPYWLGSEAWMNLYRRFMERSEIAKLPLVEAEREFMKYADSIIETHNDFQFIRIAFDDRWVMQHNFFLYREEKGVWGGKQGKAVTIDPKRVVERIAHLVLNPDLRLPSIELVDRNNSSGAFLIRHNVERQIPLERKSMAKTLYTLAQLLRRPVSIDTVFSRSWNYKPLSLSDFDYFDIWANYESVLKKIDEHQKLQLDTWPMRVTVSPAGDVTVSYAECVTVTENGVEVTKQKPDWLGTILYPGREPSWSSPGTPDRYEEIQDELEGAVQGHALDLSLSYELDRKNLGSVPKSVVDGLHSPFIPALDNVPAMKVNAPTAPAAVLEFFKDSKLRLGQILKLMAEGKWAYTISKGYVQFKILPDVPEFALDRKVIKKRKGLLPPSPVDGAPLQAAYKLPALDAFGNAYLRDEDTDIGEDPRIRPGDDWPIPDGDGGGDGDDASAGGGGDGSVVRIPIKNFIEFLIQELKLRNLRKTDGGDLLAEDEIRFGRLQNDGGERIEDETAKRAIEKAMAILRARGVDPRTVSGHELLKIGMRHFTPDDIVVPNREMIPTPDKKAVLVWARDSSGSMSERHIKVIDQFVALAEALLRTQYPSVEHVFILASDTAKEVTRDEFFSMHMGFGTQMDTAVAKQKEVMDDRFPREQFNRFPFLFSDGDDFYPDKTIAAVEKLLPEVELYGYGHIEPDAMGPARAQLSGMFRGLQRRKPEIAAYAEFSGRQDSIIKGLKAYFAEPDK